jgi:hypothetical protein
MWKVLILLLFCEKSEMAELLSQLIVTTWDFLDHHLYWQHKHRVKGILCQVASPYWVLLAKCNETSLLDTNS